MGMGVIARIAAGVAPNALHAERVDGYNPLAVIDAYRRKLPVAKKEGPVFLDVITYRFSGHSPSDSSSYRTREEIEAWEQEDSIEHFAREIMEAGVATREELDAVIAKVRDDITRNLKLAIDDTISPHAPVLGSNPNYISDLMFSNGHVRTFDEGRMPDVLLPLRMPRVQQLQEGTLPFGCGGKPVSKNRCISCVTPSLSPSSQVTRIRPWYPLAKMSRLGGLRCVSRHDGSHSLHRLFKHRYRKGVSWRRGGLCDVRWPRHRRTDVLDFLGRCGGGVQPVSSGSL